MKRFTILFVSAILVFLATIFYTYRIVSKLDYYQDKKQEILELLDAEARLGNLWEWVPYFGPGDEVMSERRFLEMNADAAYNSAMHDGIILAAIVLSFILFVNLAYRKKDYKAQSIGMSLVIASICFLYLGLQSPFMEIEAFKDDVTARIPVTQGFEFEGSVEGRVYFLYQNKSVIELIKLLYLGGNMFVAIVLIIASIVFPVIKLISSLIVFFNPNSKYSMDALTVIDKLGKWSMADVFVSSIFLAYFSFANMSVGVDTGSKTLIGLYFFTAFVVFSIFSAHYLKHTVIKESN